MGVFDIAHSPSLCVTRRAGHDHTVLPLLAGFRRITAAGWLGGKNRATAAVRWFSVGAVMACVATTVSTDNGQL